MTFTLTPKTETRQSIEINVPVLEVDAIFSSVLQRLGNGLKVPGFRKGKAPSGVIMQRFTKEIHQEVAESLVRTYFWKSAQEANVTPISNPSIEKLNLKQGSDASFTALFDVAPKITLPSYRSLTIPKVKRKVDADLIEEQLQELRQRAAKNKPLETDVDARSIVTCDIKVTPFRDDGKPEKTRFFKDQVIEIDKERLLDQSLVGMRLDEMKAFTLEHPTDDPNAGFAGKKIAYQVTVKDHRIKVVPELDDELAKDLGSYASVDELKTALVKDLEEATEKDANARCQAAILDLLLAQSAFEVPQSMIQLQLDDYCREFASLFTQQGMDPKRINWEGYRAHRLKDAERSVRSGYIIKELGDVEKIEVTEDEVNQEIQSFMDRNRITVPLIQVRSQLEERGAISEIQGRVRTEKIFNHILSLATVKEELLDKTAFDALIKKEQQRETPSTLNPFDKGSEEDTLGHTHDHEGHTHHGHSHSH